MKIFMYSDLHISRTSSIIPIGNDSKYTYRQQMIINTGKYLVDIIEKEKPDLIINLGDTFDQHTVTSYDINVASEFFKTFRYLNIPHLVLVGNHEMINQNFNAIELLSNINNITVISDPSTINTKIATICDEDIDLAFLPYCNHQDILEFPKGTYLFAHQDIQGSIIRGDFKLPDGIDPSILKDNYKLVFNGHIHKSSINSNVINVGSISTHSFSDDEEAVPQCYVFDTNTMDLKTFKSEICPLFRKFNIENTLDELKTYINNLNSKFKYILHLTCPFEIKEEVKEYINSIDLVIANRLNVKVAKETKIEETESILNLQSNIDIKQSFKEFLNITELKLPISYYEKVLEGVE